jgi:hypothetical protein
MPYSAEITGQMDGTEKSSLSESRPKPDPYIAIKIKRRLATAFF